jgi:uncharacterized protein (TIGR02186 family)
MKRLFAVIFVSIVFYAGPAFSQDQAGPAPRESIDIGLSTDTVTITSDFSGADLTIFGAVENADPLLMRQGRYDIVVVLEGPSRPVTVRKKDRVFGIWINTQSVDFENVPASYLVSTTRATQDITDDRTYQQLSLGINHIFLQPAHAGDKPEKLAEFSQALRNTKRQKGLYGERVGGVRFLSNTLFRASVALPASVPLGTHKARAFLFKNSKFIGETSAQLHIAKSGFEQTVYRTAHEDSLIYGLFAVLLAMVTGWLGRIIFRRD